MSIIIVLPTPDLSELARRDLASGRVTDPDRREEFRHAGYPPLRLAKPGELAPVAPAGWTYDTREPCVSGHGDDEECDECRGEYLSEPGRL